MKDWRIATGLLVAVVGLTALAGCGSSDGGSGTGEPVFGTGTTETVAPSAPETVTAEPGQEVTKGPWTVVLSNVNKGTSFGKHVADEGTLILVEVDITNTTPNQYAVEPRDFSLTDGESYTGALEGDDTYTPKALIAGGATERLSAVFFVPPFVDQSRLTFVFQNLAVENVRIEFPLP